MKHAIINEKSCDSSFITSKKKYESEKTRDIYVNIANEKRKLGTLKAKMDAKRVHPIPNKKFRKGSGNQSYSLEYELYIRAMMSTIYRDWWLRCWDACWNFWTARWKKLGAYEQQAYSVLERNHH